METNPYKSPTSANEPLKVRSRLMTFFDVVAIICAGLPLVPFFLFLFVIDPDSLDGIFDTQIVLGIILSVVFLAFFAGYPVSALYNLVGVIKSRRTAYIGLATNIITIAVYAAGYFIDWSAWRVWN